MRYTRVIPPVALLATLLACTAHTPSFNPAPHPSPGQAVAIAGNGKMGPAMAGQWALRSPIAPAGTLAAAPDGTLYLPVRQNGEDGSSVRIARISADGRLSLIGTPVEWHRADKLIVGAGKLWILATGPEPSLTRYSMAGTEEVRDLVVRSRRDGPTLIDEHGDPMSAKTQRRERERWLTGEHHPSAVAIGTDGIPVVALRSGELFKVPSPGKIRRWRPPGYAGTFNDLIRRGHKTDVFTRDVDDLIADGTGLTVLTIAGVVTIPVQGRAKGTPIDYPERPGFGISWAGGGKTADGALVLAARANPPAASILIRVGPGGRVSRLKVHWPRSCNGERTTSTSPRPGANLVGLTVRPNGATVAADTTCRRLYEIRPTAP